METDRKKGNSPTNWRFITFSENRKLTKNLQKRIKNNNRKLSIKLKIYNFFWKPETDQKFAVTKWKKQETDQQSENYNFFCKLDTGQKFAETGNRQTKWIFLTFSENWKQTKYLRRWIEKKTGKQPTNWTFITFLKTGN